MDSYHFQWPIFQGYVRLTEGNSASVVKLLKFQKRIMRCDEGQNYVCTFTCFIKPLCIDKTCSHPQTNREVHHHIIRRDLLFYLGDDDMYTLR